MNGDTALILNTLKVIQSDIVALKADMAEIKNDVAALKAEMDERFDAMHKEMDERFDTVNCEIRDIRMYLENTINKSIQTIAEGHFDLNRRIDEALAHKYSLEKMEVRMNIAEADIKELKKKIKGQTA